ncbi:MAG: dockerin type I repeat-containing protein, partial [Candidatus Bathyarchaeia archaeon]
MSDLIRKILGFSLIISVVLSSYLTFVNIVNAFKPYGIIQSFEVRSERQGKAVHSFVIGDTLIVEANSEVASGYELQIYFNGSVIFENSGQFSGSSSLVRVPIITSKFSAGKSYVLVFNALVHNYPIFGAFFSDSVSAVFEVVGIETCLVLEGQYDGLLHSLYLTANLTDVDGYPVSGEQVDFYWQFSRKRRATTGWRLLGSAFTDENGSAVLALAFNVPDGCYPLRAVHEPHAGFGGCEKFGSFEVSPFLRSSFWQGLEEQLSGGGYVFSGNGTVHVIAEASFPAVLPVNVTVTYSSDVLLDPAAPCRAAVIYCDYVNGTGVVGVASLNYSGYVGGYHCYSAVASWSPNVTGSHVLFAGIVVGGPTELYNAIVKGTDLLAVGERSVFVLPCPSRLRLSFPEVLYEGVLPVTAAFVRPELYNASDNGWFSTYSLAERYSSGYEEYVYDEPVANINVSLYANATLVGSGVTDEDGLAKVSFVVNVSAGSFVLSGHSYDPLSLYDVSSDWRSVLLSKINVREVVDGGDSSWHFAYSVSKSAEKAGEVYVDAANSIIVNASVLGKPVCGAPVSVLAGAPVKRSCTNSSGWVQVPYGASLMRVVCTYDVSSSSSGALADVDGNGVVNMMDIYMVAKVFGNDTHCNVLVWRADIDLNGIVNMLDLYLCTLGYGKKIAYGGLVDFSVVNATMIAGGVYEYSFDRSGCVAFPSGMLWAKLHVGGVAVGAVVEFFANPFHKICETNNAGECRADWIPYVVGKVSVLVWLPSSFTVFVEEASNVSMVNGITCLVGDLVVVKRPIQVSVNFVPEHPTLDDIVTVYISCFDSARGKPAVGLTVDFWVFGWRVSDGQQIGIWCYWGYANGSGVAWFSFVPRTYYEGFGLFPYFHVGGYCWPTSSTLAAEEYVSVDTRYVTKLELQGPEAVQVPTNYVQEFGVRLVRADTGEPVVGRPILLYMNGTFDGGCLTDGYGMVRFNLTIYLSGVYFLTAVFSWGEGYVDVVYQYCDNVTFVISAAVEPVFMLFEVMPKDFKPGATVTLKATLYNATLPNQTLQGFEVWFCKVNQSGHVVVLGARVTGGDGVASFAFAYPASGEACAFYAYVSSAQKIISSPVTLT